MELYSTETIFSFGRTPYKMEKKNQLIDIPGHQCCGFSISNGIQYFKETVLVWTFAFISGNYIPLSVYYFISNNSYLQSWTQKRNISKKWIKTLKIFFTFISQSIGELPWNIEEIDWIEISITHVHIFLCNRVLPYEDLQILTVDNEAILSFAIVLPMRGNSTITNN